MGEQREAQNVPEPQEPAPDEPEAEAAVTEKEPTTDERQAYITELEERLLQALAEAEDYKDRWMRALADYQNYRKRVMQERVEIFNEGKKQAILELLPVLDNLERALASLSEGADLEAYRQGMELIVRLFYEALRRLDVEPIPAEGQPFDPHCHEAFERVERDDLVEGTIVSEVERGYRMGERVLRPAKVCVSVKPAPPLAPPAEKQVEKPDRGGNE